MTTRGAAIARPAASVVAALLVCLICSAAAPDEFTNPQPVAVSGYSGDAEEPHLSCDGQTLFFSDTNQPGADTDLHFATRIDDLTFAYQGRLAGANSTALDAVASIDCADEFFFVSSRSYFQTLSTLYRASYSAGAVSGVTLMDGLSRLLPGWVNFDAEVTRDGSELYFVDGRFDGGPLPAEANLKIAGRVGPGYERRSDSDALLAAVNSGALEYAPATTPDSLELFFTRHDGTLPQLYRAVRPTLGSPFGTPEKITAATGFVEAPALSPDGLALYYHRAESGVFSLWRLTRTSTRALFADGFEFGDLRRWSGAAAAP